MNGLWVGTHEWWRGKKGAKKSLIRITCWENYNHYDRMARSISCTVLEGHIPERHMVYFPRMVPGEHPKRIKVVDSLRADTVNDNEYTLLVMCGWAGSE